MGKPGNPKETWETIKTWETYEAIVKPKENTENKETPIKL